VIWTLLNALGWHRLDAQVSLPMVSSPLAGERAWAGQPQWEDSASVLFSNCAAIDWLIICPAHLLEKPPRACQGAGRVDRFMAAVGARRRLQELQGANYCAVNRARSCPVLP